MCMIWRTSLLRQHVLSQSTNQHCLMASWQTQWISVVLNINSGLNLHHLVCLNIKLQLPSHHKNEIIYRSNKHLSEMTYNWNQMRYGRYFTPRWQCIWWYWWQMLVYPNIHITCVQWTCTHKEKEICEPSRPILESLLAIDRRYLW